MSYAEGESAFTFDCQYGSLIGVLHAGHPHHLQAQVGVVIVVGGPQYRVGSHRQFVLLARHLAQAGIPVLRFDYRGMGDSSDLQRTFESIDDDIQSAINALCGQVQSVKKIVLWGLCDAASAALFYASKDPRIAGLVLLNPWVRTDAGMARAYLKHYYLQRFFSAEFWKKILSGQWSMRASLKSLLELAGKLRPSLPASPAPQMADFPGFDIKTGDELQSKIRAAQTSVPERMRDSWERFNGKVLLILSGNNDYVADEFRDVVKASRPWRKLLKRTGITRYDFPEANHTFSSRAWRDQVAQWTRKWIKDSF